MKVKGNTPRIQYGPVEQYHPDQPINVLFPREGMRTIILRQKVTRFYGGTQSGIQPLFGEQSQGTVRETERYLPMQIPESKSDEDVQVMLNVLNADNKARIYDIVDFKPVLTPELKLAIVQERTSVEHIGERQIILNPETGEPVLDSITGQKLYRLRCFGVEGQSDVNLREYEVKDTREHMAANQAVVGQTKDEDDQSV